MRRRFRDMEVIIGRLRGKGGRREGRMPERSAPVPVPVHPAGQPRSPCDVLPRIDDRIRRRRDRVRPAGDRGHQPLHRRRLQYGLARSSDHRQQIVNVVGFALLAVTAIAFIWWFHAAYRNSAARGTWKLRFTSRWAIGAWFVPILAFWRPKQIADDIWRASEPRAPRVDEQEAHPAQGGLPAEPLVVLLARRHLRRQRRSPRADQSRNAQ